MKLLKCLLAVLLILLPGCQNQEKTPQTKIRKEETVTPFDEDPCFKYNYQQLTEKQQQLYEEMFNIISDLKTEGQVSYKDIKDINTVQEALLNDHPELFYLDSVIIYDDCRLETEYSFTEKEINNYQKQIQNKQDEIFQQMPRSDDYSKIKYIYDYVIDHVSYDENSKNNQLLISAMVDESTVCMGYAKMMQYLLQRAGFDTALIVGGFIDENSQIQRHAWNMIAYNDDYYYIDATWGDDEENGMIINDYFMFSSENMLKLYKPEGQYETTSNGEDTYFKKKGLYFQSYDLSTIAQAVNKENKVLEMQLSQDIYEYVKNRIINTNDVFDILVQANVYADSIQYSYNDNFGIIRVTW
ncbi:hypothetical protein H6A09_01015 [[Clostridium] spiroforme]|nr:hypothetical protein [Thomasclavelia spiroformis]